MSTFSHQFGLLVEGGDVSTRAILQYQQFFSGSEVTGF